MSLVAFSERWYNTCKWYASGPSFVGSLAPDGALLSQVIRRPHSPSVRPMLERQGKANRRIVETVDGQPFDIFVDFGLGARVLANFGTQRAKTLAQSSPLCAEYALDSQDRVARLRAGLT